MGIVTHAQNFEDVLLWRALGHVEAGFYIDVGAWDPDVHSVTRAFSERGWRGINIEPVPHYAGRLATRRPRDVNLEIALGKAPGELTLFEVAGSGLSTLIPAHAAGAMAQSLGVTERSVRMSTLAAVCAQHVTGDIHFLKIDCEGSERAVLEGADLICFRPWIIVIEATEPLCKRSTHLEWEGLLTRADYRFVWFDGLNRFYVSADKFETLASVIALPPNVFDNFQYPPRSLQPPPPIHSDPLAAATPATISIAARIDLATRCRDCDDLPKVTDAGMVQTEPDGQRIQIMHNGLKVEADGYCGAWMTDLIARCHGHHEPQEERIFDAVVRTLSVDAVMIELGSNWAYYSCWFLQNQPGRRAVLVEPDPLNRALGSRNLARNGLTATILAGIAGRDAQGSSDIVTEYSGLQSLPCYSVPQIMAEEGLERLELLHCDTQGAEFDVLNGCLSLFQEHRVDWAIISTHVHQISGDYLTHERCLRLLQNAGATIEVEHTPYESFSGDGLIVAHFGPLPAGWQIPSISVARVSEALFRPPVYDLAEMAPLAMQLSYNTTGMVDGAYQALLLRGAEQAAIDAHGGQLLATGDARHFLGSLLRSDEFSTNIDAFLALYLPDYR